MQFMLKADSYLNRLVNTQEIKEALQNRKLQGNNKIELSLKNQIKSSEYQFIT